MINANIISIRKLLSVPVIIIHATESRYEKNLNYPFLCSGHKSVIVTSEKNSDEKVNTLRLLGAEVIQTKNSDEEMAVAQKIRDSDPKKYLMLNQVTTCESINLLSNLH